MQQFKIDTGTARPLHSVPVPIFEATGADRFGEAGLWRAVLDASTDCTALLDDAGRLLWANVRAHDELGGTQSGALFGRSLAGLWPKGQRACIRTALRKARGGGTGHCTIRLVRASEVRWWDVSVLPIVFSTDLPPRLIAVAHDVTELRGALEHLRWTAAHDPLTNLGNRTLFYDCLDRLFIEGGGEGFGVVMVDLDHFKQVNDCLGHGGGDAMLKEVAARLTGLVREGDLAARVGGDEFALIIRAPWQGGDLRTLAEAIVARLCRPFMHEGQQIECSASAGLALFSEHGRSAIELCRHADAALYAAKAAGRGRLACFNAVIGEALQRRAHMVELTRKALVESRIMPWYQPKVDLRTGRIAGFEALLRWRDASGEIQLPDALIEAFDDPALGRAVTATMLDQIVADLRGWQASDIGLPVAINITTGDLARETFAADLLSRLDVAGVPPERLEIEITETVFLGRNNAHIQSLLRNLSTAGIRIALDDFGTGYASLLHLKQFPVDILKIDRSFIRNLRDDPDDQAIVEAMIGLAASLSMEVVAEGIEHEIDADFLRERGCALGQGFLFGRAVPASAVPGLLAREGRPIVHSTQGDLRRNIDPIAVDRKTV